VWIVVLSEIKEKLKQGEKGIFMFSTGEEWLIQTLEEEN